MFFLIALFVVGLVVSLFLGGSPKLTNATPGKLSDVTFPRAEEGAPVPRWYGTLKYKGANTTWDGDFESEPITKKVKTGLFSSKRQTVGFRYKIGMDLAVCLGPNFTFRRVWAGTYELWNGCLTDCVNDVYVFNENLFGGPDKNGGWQGHMKMYCGSYDQEVDDYLQSVIFPDNSDIVPAYNGVAHIVFHKCWMGNSPSILPIYIEGSCFPDALGGNKKIMPNGLDMNPVHVLYHIFSDDWGNLDVGIDELNTPQWLTAADTIWDEGNGMSLVVSSAAAASDVVKEILTQINGTMYQNPATGLYDLVLIRNDYDVADLVILGPDQIREVQNFTKILWSQTLNTVRVKFTDRTQAYKEGVAALAQDFANIRFQSKVKPQEITAQCVYDPVVANMLAARELSNLNVPLYSATLLLSRMGGALSPGTPFVLYWPEYGIVSMVMRVRKLSLGTLRDGTVTMDVVQDTFSVSSVLMSQPVLSPYVKPIQSPLAIMSYDIFELPYWLDYNAQLGTLAGSQSLGVFAKAPSAYSIGFNGYISATSGDAIVLELAPYSDSATIVAALGQFDGFVNGILPTLTIGNVTDATALTNGLGTAANGMFMLNDEIFTYDTFVDNGDATYTLHNVYRALFDSVYTAGAIGDVLYFFEGQEGFLDDAVPVAVEVDLKLADVTSNNEFPTPALIPVTPIGRLYCPLPPDGLTIAGTRALGTAVDAGASITLAWLDRSRLASLTAVAPETGPTQTPEAGTLFRAELVDLGGAVLQTVDDIAASPVDITIDPTISGNVLLKVWAKIGTTLSYNPAIYPLHVLGDITVDGDTLTIDGNGIIV